eukprot:TRINITY_DN5714_c0_g1_i1.p1 TRINITY_DN5714_c0_g1~~TRINITY_DN5714_c0_g1_i1.p1  ORF type:complete len:229 (-),score=47.28 TRINITY_DN5714_c0_g1_i1:113-799(-)
MKFLEIPSFQQLSEQIDGITTVDGQCVLDGRVEPWSCKSAGADKKLYKTLESQYQVELSKSPDLFELSATSPFGPLQDSSSRRTLIYLISLLNASFPDYDFSKVRPEQFTKEQNTQVVFSSINNALSGAMPNHAEFVAKLCAVLEQEMLVSKECDVYSYIPDIESDPFGEEGSVWSFNYFFFNKKLKRIVFLHTRALSKMSTSMGTNDFESGEEDEDWGYQEADGMEL